MSRIGKLPIALASGVEASISGQTISVKGPKGEQSYSWNEGISVTTQDNIIQVTRTADDRIGRSYHGLTRSLISNMVIGVSQGFSKMLEVNGVGYRAELEGNTIVLTVGFFNPVRYNLDPSLTATVDKNNRITISGIDKQKVGQAAAEIRRIRPPEPYKGKGIKYADEQIKRKVGKTTA